MQIHNMFARSREPAIRWSVRAFALPAVLTLLAVHPALAQTAPSLGEASRFAVLAGSAVTNTGPTTIAGDLGVSPGTAVTGFPPGLVVPPGTIHSADAVASLGQVDATNAYYQLTSQPCTQTFMPTDNLGGMTLTPGVYCFASSAQLTGTLTLDGAGQTNPAFIFLIGSTLTTASAADVKLIRGAQSCNVFWQVGSSATLGTGTSFIGNILALTSITLTTGSTLNGRALARNGAVTLDSDQVFFSDCLTAACSDTTAPTVGVTGVSAGTAGHTVVSIAVQDSGCGLASIVPIVSTNAAIVIGPYIPGQTTVVTVTATKITPGTSSVIGLRVTDVNGNVTIFDPVDFTLTAAHVVTVTGITHDENRVTIINTGLVEIVIGGAGPNQRRVRLQPDSVRTLNLSALTHGESNTLTFQAFGMGSAIVLVAPR